MITQARIEGDVLPAGLDWITALRAPALPALVSGGAPQLSLFDERDIAALTVLACPSERLIPHRNLDFTLERARKRGEPLATTGHQFAPIAAATKRKWSPLRGAAAIGMAVGAILNRRKTAKRFDIAVTHASFTCAR